MRIRYCRRLAIYDRFGWRHDGVRSELVDVEKISMNAALERKIMHPEEND